MLSVGILCGQDEEAKKIRHILELLAVREHFDCQIYRAASDEPYNPEDFSCLVLAYRDRNAAFTCAEGLWQEKPSLHIIYIAYQTEDIFSALRMPFFHTVRYFDLEQDLAAAFRKITRIKSPVSEKIGFIRNGKILLVAKKEILYLESEHHEIRLHLETEIFPVSETLTQCEKKLKGKGFVRTDRSFLVNMYAIRCLEREQLLLSNGERLYVSRRRYPEVKLMFENYIRHLDFI